MKLTKEQKEELAGKLSLPWGSVNLLCDGRLVTLQVQRFKTMTYRVMTYIDGTFKHAWASSTASVPEHKFLRKSVRPNISPAERKRLEKDLGKRYVAKHPFWGGSYTLYLPDWASGKAAISHLCKVCDSIAVASEEEEEALLTTARAVKTNEEIHASAKA
jgi:hypothetical protein